MKLVLVNEVLSSQDAGVILRAIESSLSDAQKEYGVVFDTFAHEDWLDPKKPYIPTGKDFCVYITERNIHNGAAGYHEWDSIHSVPRAYISPAQSRSVFGKFHYPIDAPAHTVGTLHIPERVYGKFMILAQGAVTAAVHEVLEVLVDPKVQSLSGVVAGTTKDAQGRAWIMEVCDPVDRNLYRWTDSITKQDCALPDFVFKSFYNTNSKGQVTRGNSVSHPFTLATGGYAYWEDDKGVLHKVV